MVLSLIDIWHTKLPFLKVEKRYVRKKYTEVTDNWNYDASSMLTSLPTGGLKN
jgi:hypothetical protein